MKEENIYRYRRQDQERKWYQAIQHQQASANNFHQAYHIHQGACVIQEFNKLPACRRLFRYRYK